MKKLVIFISVLVLSLATYADPIPVSPGTGTLTAAITAASADAVLELSAGTYNETDRLPLSKNITIKAANSAEVTIKLSKDNRITDGAKVTFDGVIIDCSTMGADYNYIFRSYGDSEGKELHFNNCEVKSCGKNYFFYAIYSSDKRQIDSCVIDRCYFHDMTAGTIIYIGETKTADKPTCKGIAIRNSYFQRCANSAIRVIGSGVSGTESCNSVIVKNSTFAGFSALDHSVIDVSNYGPTQASNIEVNIDHCTFYNNTIPDGYSCIRSSKSTNLTISNCIFAHIDPIERYATYCYGGTITNCLVHNLNKGHRTEEGFTPSNNKVANPYFLNVEYGNYDFTLAPTSPARNAGTGSSNIGDPRWQTDYSGRATTKNITATSNALKNAVDAAWPGDVIILADGEYTQGDNYTIFDKNILIKAADGASPVIKFTVPARLKQGARAEFKGLKFDMTDLHGQSWYEHLISAEDASDGNKLIFENCEFYNDAANNSTIYCASDKKLDSLVVNNCKFYDSHKSCIFLANAGLIGLKVTNSTFYNITTEDDSYYAGVIDMRTTTGSLRVDHCTFYNVKAMNTDYAAIGKIKTSDAVVSNCIFAMPASTGSYRTIRDHVTANNCLVYNYTNESGYGMQGDVTKNNCIKDKNPLFKDAENGDFTLHNASPARGKGTSSSDLGDPRWVQEISPITIPATLQPLDATMSDSAGVVLGTPNVIDFKVIGSHKYNNKEWAKWRIKVTKAGYYTFTLNAQSTNSQTYKISVLRSNETEIQTYSLSGEYNSSMTKTTDALEMATGEYFIKVENTVEWSTGDVISIVANYAGGAPTEIPGLLKAEDAVLEAKKMYHDANGYIHYGNYGTIPTDEYAYWRISTTGAYSGKVVLDIPGESGDSGHEFHVELYSDLNGSKLSEAYETGVSYDSNRLFELEQTFEISKAGTYYIKLVNATQWSSAVLRSISIAPNATISDQATDLDNVTANSSYNIQLTRSFTGGMYNTICLPFAVSASEVERVFGAAKIIGLTSSSIEEGDFVLNLNFDDVTEMVAGTPYLIKPAANISNPKFLGVTIDKTLHNVETDRVDFIGNFVAGTIPAGEDNLFLGANDMLYFSPTQDMPILGMRAYFNIHDVSAGAVRRARIVAWENVVTEIEFTLPDDTNTPNSMIQKRVENGQLLIIREGATYNALGVRIK